MESGVKVVYESLLSKSAGRLRNAVLYERCIRFRSILNASLLYGEMVFSSENDKSI